MKVKLLNTIENVHLQTSTYFVLGSFYILLHTNQLHQGQSQGQPATISRKLSLQVLYRSHTVYLSFALNFPIKLHI